jgi:TetR/AcrR family transcriptional regulator, cholesterol catabolism regulator
LETRARILHKADEICRKVGFRAMTLDEICSQLSISKKTIYQFFSDKDELVEAVMDLEIERSKVECTQAVEDSEHAIHEFMLAIDQMTRDFKDINPIVLHDLQKFHFKTYQKMMDFNDTFYGSIISNNLKRGIKEGYYREDIDVEIMTKLRIATMMLPFEQDKFPASKFDFIKTQKTISLHFLHGIITNKGRDILQNLQNQL